MSINQFAVKKCECFEMQTKYNSKNYSKWIIILLFWDMSCLIPCCCNVKAAKFVFIESTLRTHIVTFGLSPSVSIIHKLRLLKVFYLANFVGNIDCQQSKRNIMGSFICQVRKNIGKLGHLHRNKFRNLRWQVNSLPSSRLV